MAEEVDTWKICSNWAETVLKFAIELKQQDELCDLTLLSGDQTQFSVHSLVLSAASPVLKNLVVTGNTTLSFPDINHDVWSTILDLVYTGTIQSTKIVQDTEKPVYLKAADLLKLNPILIEKLYCWLNDNPDVMPLVENDRFGTLVNDVLEDKQESQPTFPGETFKSYGDENNVKINQIHYKKNLSEKEVPNLSEVKFSLRTRVDNSEEVGHLNQNKNCKPEITLKRKMLLKDIVETPDDDKKVKLDVLEEDNNLQQSEVDFDTSVCIAEDGEDERSFEEKEHKDIRETTDSSELLISTSRKKENEPFELENEMEQGDCNKNNETLKKSNKLLSVNADKLKKQRTKTGKLLAPKAIISIMKKLERQAKQEKVRTLKELEIEDPLTPVEHDIPMKCITCGTDCQSFSVKCLLCLERIEKATIADHITSEHPLFNHPVCWFSCGFKVTPVHMTDVKDRIVAKQSVIKKEVEKNLIKFHGTEFFKCSLCSDHKDLCELSEMRTHLKKKHSIQNVFVCEHCSDVFKNPGTKREHQHFCGGGEPLKCDLCGAVMDGAKAMWRHKKTVHEEVHTLLEKTRPAKIQMESDNEDTNIDVTEKPQSSQTELTENMKPEQGKNTEIKLRCVACGTKCGREVVCCVLCASNCQKADFKEHIEKFHSHCPTSTYWFRCKFVFAKQCKVGEVETDDRVIGRRIQFESSFAKDMGIKNVTDEIKSSTDDQSSVSKPKIELQCTLCPQVCSGISIMSKHCRFDHGIKSVMMCKYCNDVFRSVTMRDTHQLYCGEIEEGGLFRCESCDVEFARKESFQIHKRKDCKFKKNKFLDGDFEKELLKRFFEGCSSLKTARVLDGPPVMQYGQIMANTEQTSVCLKCAKNKHSCSANILKCFLCFQQIDADSLDSHLVSYHRHLQGVQCFVCPQKKIKSSKFISHIIGFNINIEDTFETNEELQIDEDSLKAEEDGNDSKGTSVLPSYTCSVCGDKSMTLEEFAKHSSQSHSVNELYSCKMCPVIFTTKLARGEHEFYCSGNSIPYCSDCSILFASPFLYKKHLTTEHSTKAKLKKEVYIKCPYCDTYEEHGEDRYRNHLRMIHKKTSRFFLCKTCFKTFDHNHTRDEHSFREHSNHIPLCQQCGQTFETPLKLQRHIHYWHKDGRSKEKERRRSLAEKMCQHCGKSFKLNANLTDHINRYHLHYKPYQCNYCDKKFYHTFARKKHEFKDHGAGYYECSKCGHRVYSRWDLKQHEEKAHGGSHEVVAAQGREKAPVMYDKIQVQGLPGDERSPVQLQQSRVRYANDKFTTTGMEVDEVDASWSNKEQVYFVNVNYKQPEARKIIVRTMTDEAAIAAENLPDHVVETTQTVAIDAEGQYVLSDSAAQDMVYQVQSDTGEVYQMVSIKDTPVKTEYITQQHQEREEPQTMVIEMEGEEQMVDWQPGQQEATEEEVVYILQE